MNIYKLYFGDLELAEISRKHSDFPGVSGYYRLNIKDPNSAKIEEILKYIEYSIESARIVKEAETIGKQWVSAFVEGKPPFVDLIESEEWWLQDDKGDRHNILIPNFKSERNINWYWKR